MAVRLRRTIKWKPSKAIAFRVDVRHTLTEYSLVYRRLTSNRERKCDQILRGEIRVKIL